VFGLQITHDSKIAQIRTVLLDVMKKDGAADIGKVPPLGDVDTPVAAVAEQAPAAE